MAKDQNELTDPTPVSGELESIGYRPPRLRVTATYDADGTHRPTSIDVEIHDDDVLDEGIIVRVVDAIVAMLTQPATPPTSPADIGTWTSGSGAQISGVRFTNGGRAA